MKNNIEEADRQLFEEIADSYINKDMTSYCRISRKLRLYRTLKNIPKPITSILEVGCGAGFSADYLKGLYSYYEGLDYSKSFIAYARSHNASDKAKFFCKNIKEYSNERKFQVILMIGVLHHIPEVENVLKHLKDFLEPGGVVVVNEPQRGNPLITLLRAIRKRIDSSYSSDQVEFSAVELKSIFIRCGYKVNAFPQGVLSTPLAETRILPNFIGTPLALLFKYIDPILETIISLPFLSKFAWNAVFEARRFDLTP